MALIDIKYFSDCLKRQTSVKVILPNDGIPEGNPHYDRPMKTLYLLHGYTGIGEDWIWNSSIVEYAGRYNLCVVLPNGENSFFLDGVETGRQYASFVGKELPAYLQKTFGLSAAPEDNFTGGLSMGGFGALHTALAFPENFGKAVGLSSALISYRIAEMKPGMNNAAANYEYYRLMFGDPDTFNESDNNPEELVRRIQKAGGKVPGIYMACGTEDFLLSSNRTFADFLRERNVDLIYHESTGIHDFRFWNQYLEPAIRWLVTGTEET